MKEERENNLHSVFKRLADEGLTVRQDKCFFFEKEVSYLGLIISEHGVLAELHGSHLGIVKCRDDDVKRMCLSCRTCGDGVDLPPKTPLVPWSWPSSPVEQVHLDFFLFKNITHLVLVDAYCKWIDVIPMSTTTVANTILKLIISISNFLQRFHLDYRNSIHGTTGETPARLKFERHLRSRLDLLKSGIVESISDRFLGLGYWGTRYELKIFVKQNGAQRSLGVGREEICTRSRLRRVCVGRGMQINCDLARWRPVETRRRVIVFPPCLPRQRYLTIPVAVRKVTACASLVLEYHRYKINVTEGDQFVSV